MPSIYFPIRASVQAQDQEDEETISDSSYHMESYEPYEPALIQVHDSEFIAICNQIRALRPVVEDAFARARFKIAEDDLDEYQSALRRIEHAERYEWYEGQDAMANAYENLQHVSGVIARLEALSTPSLDDFSASLSILSPTLNEATSPTNEFTQYLFNQLLKNLKSNPWHTLHIIRSQQSFSCIFWFFTILAS